MMDDGRREGLRGLLLDGTRSYWLFCGLLNLKPTRRTNIITFTPPSAAVISTND